jgi:hypothetical protein
MMAGTITNALTSIRGGLIKQAKAEAKSPGDPARKRRAFTSDRLSSKLPYPQNAGFLPFQLNDCGSAVTRAG